MQRRDPLALMLEVATYFADRADALDKRIENAINADASQDQIVKLMDLSSADRMRCLAAAQAAAPFVHPKLQAVELAPASQSTVSRFEQRITNMTEDQVTEHLKQIASGASAIEIIEVEDGDNQ